MKLSLNKTALSVGVFFSVIHAIWALTVALIPKVLQKGLDWVFNVHFLEPIWKLTAFSFVGAIELIIITFVFGYLFGILFALAWNWLHKK